MSVRLSCLLSNCESDKQFEIDILKWYKVGVTFNQEDIIRDLNTFIFFSFQPKIRQSDNFVIFHLPINFDKWQSVTTQKVRNCGEFENKQVLT